MQNRRPADRNKVKTVLGKEEVEKGSFTCSNCGSLSRLSRIPQRPGLYKITCFHCKEPTYLRVSPPSPPPEIPAEEPKASKHSNILEEAIRKKKEEKKHRTVQETEAVNVPKEKGKGIFEETPVERKPLYETEALESEEEPVLKPTPEIKKEKERDFIPKRPVLRDFLWEKNVPLILRSRGLLIFSILFAIAMIFGLTFLVMSFNKATENLDGLLTELSKNKPSMVYDRSGNLLSEIYQKKVGTSNLEDFPKGLVQMILAVEDRNFYDHGGIDYIAIFRALFRNISHFGYSQGASTITMQLSRILIKDRQKSLSRKFREAEIAFALETRLKKDEILKAYLNQVYLGHGAYGFENAAMYYFNRELKDLKVKEMILLASLASAPERYSPFKHRELSKKRVKIIVEQLIRYNIIQPSIRAEIDDFYAGLKPPPYKSVFKGRYDEAPYVTEHVRSILKAVNPDKNIYYEGGFKIETTIQLDLQKQAILDTQKHVDYLTGKKGGIKKVWLKKDEKPPVSDDSTLQAAVIGLDPQTGEILFMHGGGDRFHQDNQLNRAIQIRRQTGSSIKPVLYAAAIDSGKVHTGMRVMDAKVFYRGKNGEKDWTPNNFDKEYLGEISLRTALEKSKNTVAVQIAEKIGLSTVARYYQQFFFPDPQEYKKRYRDDLSVALGSLEFSPLEMATVFSSFANDGKIQRPYLIRRITSSTGKVIYEYDLNDEFNMKIPFERRVVNPDTAEVMISLMTSSARYSSVRKTGYKGIVAGKTGTTNDYKDAWFVGLKPNLSLAVWIGYDDSAYGMGPKGVGSLAAAPLWGTIAAHADTLAVLPKRSFTFSKNAEQIEICKETGLDASACPCEAKEKEFFTSKAKPSKECIAPAVDKSNSIQSLF